jgi:hypothetical protein
MTVRVTNAMVRGENKKKKRRKNKNPAMFLWRENAETLCEAVPAHTSSVYHARWRRVSE